MKSISILPGRVRLLHMIIPLPLKVIITSLHIITACVCAGIDQVSVLIIGLFHIKFLCVTTVLIGTINIA